MKPEEALELWYKALAAKFGIVIRTNKADQLKSLLYTVRKPYPELQALFISYDAREPEVLKILHKEIKVNKDAKEID